MNKLTIDSLLKTPQISNVMVSPDLKWVTWQWRNLGPNTDVYIASIEDKEGGMSNPRKISDFKQNTSVIFWCEDSKNIILRYDNNGDERYCLNMVNIATGEVVVLTDKKPEYYIRSGVTTPDNKYLIYGANFDFELNKEIEQTIIYRQNIKTGERKILASPKKPGYTWPKINKQGTHIIYERKDISPKGMQVYLVDIDGKNDKEILNFGDDKKVSAIWHSDGTDIVFIAEDSNYKKVGLYNINDNSVKIIIDDSKRNIEEVYVPLGTDLIIIDETKNAQSCITSFNIETLEEKPISSLKNIIPSAKIGNFWLSKYYNSGEPGDIVIHDENKIVKQITNVFETVNYPKEEMVRAENYVWEAEDGLKIQGWLYRTKILPAVGTVLLIHGGPSAHSEDSWNLYIQYFTSQGFNVLDPNYRGSTGFSLDFQNAIKIDGWGGREQTDMISGIKSLIKDGIAELGKVGVIGTSYGGYSSWFLITHFSTDFVKVSVPICGMTDLVVDYETTRPDIRAYSEEMMGGSPKEVPEKYYNASPINFVKNIKADLLIVQGAKDPNVTLENVREIEHALKKENISYEKIIFDDEGHGVSKPSNKKILLVKCAEFFKKAFA